MTPTRVSWRREFGPYVLGDAAVAFCAEQGHAWCWDPAYADLGWRVCRTCGTSSNLVRRTEADEDLPPLGPPPKQSEHNVRDQYILSQHQAGVPLSKISWATGLTKTRVHQIVAKAWRGR